MIDLIFVGAYVLWGISYASALFFKRRSEKKPETEKKHHLKIEDYPHV